MIDKGGHETPGHTVETSMYIYIRAALGLAENSSTWVLSDLVCHDIFSSCALMRFFTVGHQVCDFDLSASSTQLKPISWPRSPGYKLFSWSLSWSAPSTASGNYAGMYMSFNIKRHINTYMFFYLTYKHMNFFYMTYEHNLKTKRHTYD